jgi:oxygen-independent coproporphyrinogen-3 oxidase
LVGLGVSSISDAGVAYVQNEKTIHDYYKSVQQNELPVNRGFFLNEEDVVFKKYILDIACKGKTQFKKEDLPLLNMYVFPELQFLEEDGLLHWNEKEIQLTGLGCHFIRNTCRAFDLHLLRTKKEKNKPKFSRAI